MKRGSGAAGWLPLAAIAAIAAVNIAGIWGILLARRGALEQADKLFHAETAERARGMESVLSSTRADLAFLVASPAMLTLERDLRSEDPREARWRRLAVEGAFLLFLRSHPQTRSLVVRSGQSTPLVAAGRRGGVPVLWLPSQTPEDRSGRGAVRPIVGRFEIVDPAQHGGATPRLEAEIDPALLLPAATGRDGSASACWLDDHQGIPLASDEHGARAVKEGGTGRSAAMVVTEGWSAAAPWRLTCARAGGDLGFLEPVAARYRATIVMILAIMALAVVLGFFAIQQARRGQALEAQAREEARVRVLERQLFHAERLSTVGRLAAGMAHEINNPLEGIGNYLRLAREDLERGDSRSAARRLEGVKEGLERAAGIVSRVLAHADPATAPRTRVDLNSLVAESAGFVRSRPEFSTIDFTLDLDPSAPEVSGDAVTLGQLFLNLVLNACEAQPNGGAVTISTRVTPAGEVVSEVADRGPGVPAADRARIFEPFFTTKASTGLGLSICHAIARQHQADLTVLDRPGGGALLRLVMPQESREPRAQARRRHA